MPTLLQLQKLPGKGDGGWKKSVFASFMADQKIASSWDPPPPPKKKKEEKKKHFGASYSTSNKLLLVARHILTTGLQKCL